MKTQDTIQILEESERRIAWLQRRNELLEAKVSVVETFRLALVGNHSESMEPDFTYSLRSFIEELKKELEPTPTS